MSFNRWKLVAMPVVMLGIASPLLVNCGAGGAGGLGKLPGPLGEAAAFAGGCDEMKSGDFSAIKIEGGADGKIKGFLKASFELNKVAVTMETDLIAACAELGKALGVGEADLKADAAGGKGAEKVCGAVAAKVSATMKASADAKISVTIGEPKCHADIEAMNKCLGDCGSPITPGKLEASCKGGEISGKCDAECKGKCTVDAGAECKGTCNATCSGSCDAGFKGSCGGKCDGKCDGKDSKGAACAGTCDGKCDAKAEGSCSGTCGGSCSASCEIKGSAKCSGSCTGGCSAEMKAPSCTGSYEPPGIDPSCQVSCAGQAAASVKCDPPEVKVVVNGKASADVYKTVSALGRALPKIVKIQLGTAKTVAAAGEGVIKAGGDMAGSLTAAGGKAIACIKAGVEATTGATASVSINVKASASVSGSAKGGT
jgi:hypothetical protein